MKIVEIQPSVVFFRKPRSKRRRIIEKWRKNPDNNRTVYETWYCSKTNTTYCPKIIAQTIRAMYREQERQFYNAINTAHAPWQLL